MQEQAAAVAAAAIDPAKKDIAASVAAAEAQRVAALNAYAGVTRAVSDMSAGDAEQARAAFATAGQHIADYGKGFTGQLRADQDESAARLGALGASLGAPGAVTSGGESNANTLYATGGAIPATQLETEAPAFLTAVAARRLAAGIRLADDASAGDFKAQEGIKQIRDQLAALEAKRPGLIQDAMQQLSQQANAKRATDTQIGYLQLQQAKSAQDAAIAWTNITGTVHVVRKGKVVDTGQVAAGSDAAQIASANQRAQTAAETSTANAQLSARTRKEIAEASAAASKYAADTAAHSREAVAATNAAAKKAAASVKKTGKATPAQRSTIITAAGKRGSDLVKSNVDRIWQLTPGSQAQGAEEKDDDYNKRIAAATKIFNNRLHEHRLQIVARVAALIAAQLKLIGYTPAEIRAQADAIVTTRIPAR